jgi:iron complex transport system substrate-binding protein
LRLISICPSNTELLAYLGVTSQLIAIDNDSDWPEDINHLPRVGQDLSIDMDKVEQLKPDLVIASLSVPGMERNIAQLEQRGIPHLVLNPNSLQDIANDLLTLGKAIREEEKAKEVVEHYNSFITTYKQLATTISTRPTLYWEWWPKPVFTPGKTNWLTEISELAGCKNSFDDYEVASFQTDWETVHRKNPNHICLVWVGVKESKMNRDLIRNRPNWGTLNAVKNDQIHILQESLYCRPSPRLLLGLKKLASIVHPDVFPIDDDQDSFF